jgi:hypothetical protein
MKLILGVAKYVEYCKQYSSLITGGMKKARAFDFLVGCGYDRDKRTLRRHILAINAN